MMRLQFATFEAVVAFMISISILIIVENMINSYNSYSFTATGYLQENMAFYDLENQIYSNVSMHSCIYDIKENASCMINYLKEYKKLYKLDSFGIIFEGIKIGNFSGNFLKCIPYQINMGNSSESEFCIYEGD
jgi:hypothetical protein